MPDKYEKMRSQALAQVGKPYRFGAEVDLDDPDPAAFDCSELTQWLFAQAGIDIGDGTWNQENVFSIDIGQPSIVGDLFFMPGHVGVYAGKGQVVEARNSRVGVVKTDVAGINRRNGDWRRLPGWKEIQEDEEMHSRELQVEVTDRGLQVVGANNEPFDGAKGFVEFQFRRPADAAPEEIHTYIHGPGQERKKINKEAVGDSKLRVITIGQNKAPGAFGIQVTPADALEWYSFVQYLK